MVLLVALSALAAFRSCDAEPPTEAFTPPPFDAAAQTGTPGQTGERYGLLELPLAEGRCTVGMEPDPALANDRLRVNLTASTDNTVWIRVVLYDGDQLAGESGILRPGEYVESIALTRPVASGTELKAKLLTYEPDTYYSMGTATATLCVP